LTKKILLAIAGYDPSAGAGALLDLKVFEFLGFRGMAVLTSLTSQNSRLVKEVRCLPPDSIWISGLNIKFWLRSSLFLA